MALIAAACLALAAGDPASTAIGARCESCHASETRAYRANGMARALGPIERGELGGLAEIPDASTGFSYRLEAGEKDARIVETWRDPTGERASASDSSLLDFAIGAGIMDRSFAARRGRLLWFAPLEVQRDLASGERHAALSPGHSIQPGARFTIPITEECLRCHTTSLPPRDYPLNLVPDMRWQPAGIDCGGCHARADEHARWREREKAGEKPGTPDPGLVTTFGDPIESVSVCARCHLQGDANLAVRPPDRGIPPPGGDLLDARAIFVAATPSDDVGFVSQVERLALSACFRDSLSSAKPMTCVTCHAPHRSVCEPEASARTRAACTACHPEESASHATAKPCALAPKDRGTSDCVACHMRRTPVFDVADVLVHDHRIVKRPAPPSRPGALRVKESKDGSLALFEWPGHAPRAHADDPGLRFMATTVIGRADLARTFASKPPGPASAALPMYFHMLGSLRERDGRLDDAIKAYERALLLDPVLDETLVNLGGALARLQKNDAAIAALTGVIERRPFAEGAFRNRGVAKLGLGDGDGFARDLETALAIHPQAAVARALAQHHRAAGRADRAAQFEAEAQRLDPAFRP